LDVDVAHVVVVVVIVHVVVPVVVHVVVRVVDVAAVAAVAHVTSRLMVSTGCAVQCDKGVAVCGACGDPRPQLTGSRVVVSKPLLTDALASLIETMGPRRDGDRVTRRITTPLVDEVGVAAAATPSLPFS
jgi:hypothetical protein